MKSSWKDFAEELASASGEVIRKGFHNEDFTVTEKADGTPVTDTDRAAERVLRERIETRYPEHGIIGEEYGNVREDAEYVWVLDPIDGTISYLHGVPLFGTLIGLLERGRPILGVIHQPILGYLLIGDNETTEWNEKPIRVREERSLEAATLLVSDPSDPFFLDRGPAWGDLLRRAGVVRSWGDCFGYLLLAGGRADVMVDPVLSPWDLLPLLPVLRGAGVTVTDREGGDPEKGDSLVAATTAGLHAEVLRALSD